MVESDRPRVVTHKQRASRVPKPGESLVPAYTRGSVSLLSYVVFALAVIAARMASVLLTKRAPFLSLLCALLC